MFFDDIVFNLNEDNKPTLFNCEDGFMYGNMFANEYDSYKNYPVSKLKSDSKKGELMLKIYQYDFALNDLSLYLDLHPDDNYVYKIFKKYTEEQRKYVDLYEKMYGPMELNDSDYSSYMWEKGPWPFAGGKVDV